MIKENGARVGYFVRKDGVVERIKITYENEYFYEYINIEDKSRGLVEKNRVKFNTVSNYHVSIDVTITVKVNYSVSAEDEDHARKLAIDNAFKRLDIGLEQDNTVDSVTVNSVTKIL